MRAVAVLLAGHAGSGETTGRRRLCESRAAVQGMLNHSDSKQFGCRPIKPSTSSVVRTSPNDR